MKSLVVFIILMILFRLSSGIWPFNSGAQDVKLPLLLWTRKNRMQEDVFIVDKTLNSSFIKSLSYKSCFNASSPVKILIHGFLDHGKTDWIIKTKNRLLNMLDANVFSLDWASVTGSSALAYPGSVVRIRDVGTVGSSILRTLILHLKVPPSNIHVIGFSLGAHVAGIAGKTLPDSLKINRITGLDPAALFFTYMNEGNRISKESAKFVDIVHTSAPMVGISESLGHVDFFPNSGRASQPGCAKENNLIKKCSHFFSVDLFYHSIGKPKYFVSRRCRDWKTFTSGLCKNNEKAHMGFHTHANRRGNYYLRTSPTPPYTLLDTSFISEVIGRTPFINRFLNGINNFLG